MSKEFKRKVVHTFETVGVYTVKSVYRKKTDCTLVLVNFSVNEDDTKYLWVVDRSVLSEYDFLKKGTTITIHKGDNGFYYIEKGKHVSE